MNMLGRSSNATKLRIEAGALAAVYFVDIVLLEDEWRFAAFDLNALMVSVTITVLANACVMSP